MSEIIAELENISEILFNNGYNSWGNAIRKAIAKIKEQQLDIDALKNTIQGMVEGQCIIAGSRIVRCKNCKHCYDIDMYGYVQCDKAETHEPDWFCADGERKD